MDTQDAAWIGRQERRRDVVAAGPLDRWAATLDREDPPARAGDPLPPLAHWLLFPPGERQSALGADGHARRGGFLPPLAELPRRMWAGGRLAFHAPPRVGMTVERSSTIAAIRRRQGASGPLAFVTLRHELREAGREAVLLTEEHDIVYRAAGSAAARPEPGPPPGPWQRRLVPDAVLLFRYSALTFNGHRIHYDRAYATAEEGYPGLVVHGPLIATLLLDLLRRQAPGLAVTAFAFRALAPLFDGTPLLLHGAPPDGAGRAALWATDAAGGLLMRAEAQAG